MLSGVSLKEKQIVLLAIYAFTCSTSQNGCHLHTHTHTRAHISTSYVNCSLTSFKLNVCMNVKVGADIAFRVIPVNVNLGI